MAILALATSGPEGGLALQSAGGALHEAPLAAGRGRGRDVMPAVQALLDGAGLAPRDLDAIAVDVGPGSFTGVRVGVTVAKSLAWALDAVLFPVGALELLAHTATDASRVLAVRDAGRGTVYHATFEDGRLVGEAGRLPGEDLAAAAAALCVVGEEASALARRYGWSARLRDVAPGARDVLHLAETRRAAGAAPCPPHRLVPTYLQASAPERKAAGESS